MTPLTTHSVRAFNTAAASENKIHDDTVAQRFGFRGALVPGVDVFAYMAHVPVAHFGCTWLKRGQAECRFLKPVYDGDIARVILNPFFLLEARLVRFVDDDQPEVRIGQEQG